MLRKNKTGKTTKKSFLCSESNPGPSVDEVGALSIAPRQLKPHEILLVDAV